MWRSRQSRRGGQIGYSGMPARARDGQQRSGRTGRTVTQANVSAAAAVSDRVKRHLLVDRVYHWLMAACVLTLLATAFLPIIGYKFEWLGLHWTTGVALSVLVVIHIVRAVIWQDFWAMMIDGADLRNGWRRLARALGSKGAAPGKAGTYNGLPELFHAGIAALVLSIVATGLLTLLQIGTPP